MPIAILLSQRLRWLLTGITLLIPLFASAQAQPTCGAPAFTVPGHYLSQDCSSGRWSVHAWSGSNFRALSGSVESEEPLQHILRRSIENSDQIAITQGNRRIAWTMKVVGRGRDELQFAPAPGTEACLKVTGPVFHRSAAQSLAAEVAIPGLGACGGVPATPTLSIDDATATESAGSVTLSVSLSLPTTSAVQVRIATEDDTAEANTDYQPLMQQQVIDFAPGETEKPITVTLIDDDLQEDPERFRLQLSDAIGADIEADGGAVVTIVDGNGPGCGRPTYSSGTEAALYVYTDCASSQLLIEAASGGPFIQYNAELTSEAPIEVARRIGIETSDRIELRDGNQTLSLTLKTTGVGTDAVALELDPGVRSCLRLQQPLNLIRYGSEAIPANNELDPATGGPCDSTPLPATLHVSDQTVREEQGQMQFTVELRNATDSTTTVGVMVEDLDATVGTDYVAETLPTILSFAPSEETKQIPIQLLNDSLEEGPEQFAVQLDMPQNALLAGSGRAVVTIEDDDVRCGAPAAANRQQAGLYLFRDCASQRYRVEAQAAGRFVALMGTLQSSSELLNPQGIGLEASDSLDTRSDPSALSFTFKVTGRGVDAAEFGLEPLASGCFERTAPNDAPVFYGPAAQAMPASFDITTGTECAAGIPQVSVLDQTLAESDPSGAMRFIVTLSQPAATTVLISYETRDGDATGDVDYVPQAGQIAIPAGALTATVDIPLLDDLLSEDDERFSLHLLNTSVNARLQHPTATGVIIDDETQELTLGSTSATEAEGVARVELAIAAPATQAITVAYRTREGSALQNEDYPYTEGSIEFPPGTTRVVIEIPLIADSEDERAENFFLDVFDANGVNIGESSAMITILPARYNVVVILTDDQRWDTLWAMPSVQTLLADPGVTFNNAFITTPLCCPARASIYSGGFLAQNTGVLRNQGPNGGPDRFADDRSLATTLQPLGYRTMFIGKYFAKYAGDVDIVRSAPYIPPGWTRFVGRSVYANVTDWRSFIYSHGNSDQQAGMGMFDAANGQYTADYERDQILNFVEESAEDPFFILWSTSAPHARAQAAPGDEGTFNDYRYAGRGRGEQDLSDKPRWIRNYTSRVDSDAFIRKQLQSLQAVDRGVEAIVNGISAAGVLDRTVFIFTSDNGYLWGEHGAWGKGKPYEEAVHVPFVVRMPGVEAGSNDHLIAANLDIGASIYDWLGLNAASDGLSIEPLLQGTPDAPWREHLLLEGFGHHDGADGRWTVLRKERWKYIDHPNGERELYDLETDPYELESLHNDTNEQGRLDSMAAELEVLKGINIVSFRGALPAGRVGVPFEYQLRATGGTAPYAWRIVSGQLPDGVALDPDSGLISGRPENSGTFNLIFEVAGSGIRRHTGEQEAFRSLTYTFRVNR